MALNATILKVDLSLADTDRHLYADHSLTIAHHPSETAERVMIRLLAYAMYAGEQPSFGRGLSSDDEPDLVCNDLTGAIQRWIMVGLPDERLVRRASGRATRVALIAYGGSRCEQWWRRHGADLARLSNLDLHQVITAESNALAGLVARTMRLAVTVQDGEYLFSSADQVVRVTPRLMSRDRSDDPA